MAADAKERRSLLTGLAQASAGLEPRGELGLGLFRRLYAQAHSLQLLVELRADMLRWRNQVAGLSVLERELQGLLSSWFDVGMLELRPINWDSPASLLEKLIEYEAVHEIRSWEELRHRVASHRRCYAFFHPRMSDVPLIFVEVAFAAQMAGNVQLLLDPQVPAGDPDKARWAIFYSISNTQPGLRHEHKFYKLLLKRVIDELLRELPRLKSFATLSPIPGFVEWLSKLDGKALQALLHDKAEKLRALDDPAAGQKWVGSLAGSGRRTGLGGHSENRLAACRPLLEDHEERPARRSGGPLPPGKWRGDIERLNWAADCSAKGMAQSCGIMATLYELGNSREPGSACCRKTEDGA